MKKRYIIALVGTLLAIIFFVILYFTLFNFEHIEDTNGGLTNLETIQINEMINSEDSYIVNNSSIRHSGNTTGISGKLEEVDYEYIKHKSKKFSGVMTIHVTNTEANQKLRIEVENELHKGNLEIIIVAPDNTLVATCSVNSADVIEVMNTIKGTYHVVIGGESAEFSIIIERNIE